MCMHAHTPVLVEISGMKAISTAAFTYYLAKTSCLHICRKIQSKDSRRERKCPHRTIYPSGGKGMETKNAGL